MGVINGLKLPRYALATNNKLFITQWGDAVGSVAVVALPNLQVIKTIAVGNGPEKIIDLGNNRIAVLNSGGFGVDSTVSIINTTTELVEKTIVVGHNPTGVALVGNNLWVLLSGINDFSNPLNNTPGGFAKLNLLNLTLSDKMLYTSAELHPRGLVYYNEQLYFLADYIGGVRKMRTDATNLPAQNFINGNFYALGCDLNGDLWTADALDFNSNGKVSVWKNTDASKIKEFTAGIIPGNFYFY